VIVKNMAESKKAYSTTEGLKYFKGQKYMLKGVKCTNIKINKKV